MASRARRRKLPQASRVIILVVSRHRRNTQRAFPKPPTFLSSITPPRAFRVFQTSRISVSQPPELWTPVPIRLSLGATAASFEGYILAAFIRCRRAQSACQTNLLALNGHSLYTTYICIYIHGVLFYRSAPRRHTTRVAPRGKRRPRVRSFARLFVPSFLPFVRSASPAMLVKARNTRCRLGASWPRDTANVTFTIFDYRVGVAKSRPNARVRTKECQ